jgi:hypothetical protein
MHRSTRNVEDRYGYDAAYLHPLIDASAGAGLRGALLPVLSQYRGPEEGHRVWAGAALGQGAPCIVGDLRCTAREEAPA